MIDLMKLELKRNNLRTYQIVAAVTFVLVLGFTYLFAYVPRFNPEDADLLLFSGYGNVFSLSILICMAVFCVLSAVMYARFIIDEYAGKRATLLFSYPISRRKVLLSKVFVVFLFNFCLMIVCSLLALGIFVITEQFAPMVNDTLSRIMVLRMTRNIILMASIAPLLGIVATGIGFIRKSIPTTIVTAVVMISVLGNLMSGALQNDKFLVVLLFIAVAASVIACGCLMFEVNRMEVE
ncbi:ABC-type transport system involved in multi-copper enzyme maturation permease subunit [Lachnospiraceae bacterium PF1-22]|uniref:ABC transporter permease n=1 Tax=Ohessyouella blattaphilus TaxID=2949333 RepID=UPI003E275B62